MLIVIDGIDGTGKTTQTKLLLQRLKQEGYKTATLDFPQYTQNFFGKVVKRFLDGEFGKSVDPHLASILYALDRLEAKQKLQKWLKQKRIVVLNRYTSANLIHQGAKIKDFKSFNHWIETMEYKNLGLPKPDMVIYLHLPYTLAYDLIEKRGKKKDIHEGDPSHLKAAEQQGLRLAMDRKDWYLVQCNRDKEILTRKEIGEMVWKIVKGKLT